VKNLICINAGLKLVNQITKLLVDIGGDRKTRAFSAQFRFMSFPGISVELSIIPTQARSFFVCCLFLLYDY